MRAAMVWTVAAVCGVAAFGSTLVWRAPRLPPPPPSFRVNGPGAMAVGLAELEQQVVNQSSSLFAWFDLGRRYTWAGRLGEANMAWRQVARLAEPALRSPGEHQGLALYTFALAEAQHALREANDGKEEYEEAMRLYEARLHDRPNEPMLLYRLGWCARRLGLADGGRQYFAQLDTALSPGNFPTNMQPDQSQLYLLAASRAMRGYLGLAIDPIEQMIKLGYDDSEALMHAEEFESLRTNERFMAVLAKIPAKKTPDGQSPPTP